jgi:twitching motility two-component system response regulator PilG
MPHGQYQPKQLGTLLEILHSRRASGTLRVNAAIDAQPKARSRVLVLQDGEITYGGYGIPAPVSLAKKLTKQFKPAISEIALKFAKEKVTDPASARELLEILCKIRVLSWEQIESFVLARTASVLEQILPYAGRFQFNPKVEFDLTYGEARRGLNLSKLKFDVARRHKEWSYLAPTIPSMNAVPHLPQMGLERVPLATVRQHLQQWVNGKRTLVDIAETIDRDPLQVARFYLTWAQIGWVDFKESLATEHKNLPTILSVDDSPTIQMRILQALGDRYKVLLASNGSDGLNLLLLDREPVSLLLLDINLPDVDGLEICRTVRSLPKFRDLPIVMLTTKNTLVDKMKGIIAGSDRYLAKPIETEKLLKVVSELV